MGKLKEYKHSIWRVPLIAVLAGFLYTPLYVRLVVPFGVLAPGVIARKVSLLVSAGIFLAVLAAGGLGLLRKQSKKELFVSAALVVIYGLLLTLPTLLPGSPSGPAAMALLYLSKPLEWTGVFSELFLYLQELYGISLPVIGWLGLLAPFLFVPFGRKTVQQK